MVEERGEDKRRFLISNKSLPVPFPNILFLKWLEEWQSEARKKERNSQFCFAKAVESLLRYPLPLSCPKEAAMLKNIGPGIVEKLQKKWTKYLEAHPESKVELGKISEILNDHDKPIETNKTSKKPPKKYIPNYRSMSYGILLALLQSNVSPDGLTRAEIILKSGPFCNMDPQKFQPSVKSLIKHELIAPVGGRTVRYNLTGSGRELAERLYSAHVELDENIQPSENALANTALDVCRSHCRLEPGEFEVVLLIDQIELNNNSKLLSFLANRIKFQVRRLNIGDYLWIAKSNNATLNVEIVLDVLVERKTTNDLASSIIDGRFHEQKCRIKESRVQRPVYLVEGSLHSNSVLPELNLLQALANTTVRNKFLIKFTKSLQDTIDYLVSVTRYLERKYLCSVVEVTTHSSSDCGGLVPFSIFNDRAQKTKLITNREAMMAMLMQLKGISFEKALAIAEKYPTLASLYNAFSNYQNLENSFDPNCNATKKRSRSKKTLSKEEETEKKRRGILSSIECLNKKLGVVMSENVYHALHYIPTGTQVQDINPPI